MNFTLIQLLQSLDYLRNKILGLPKKVVFFAELNHLEFTLSHLCIALIIITLLFYIQEERTGYVIPQKNARLILIFFYMIYVTFCISTLFYTEMVILTEKTALDMEIPAIAWLLLCYYSGCKALEEIPIKQYEFYLSYFLIICSVASAFFNL